jgi:hypothetical protein
MNKQNFLKTVQRKTRDQEVVKFYDELISDRTENGESEESVISSINISDIKEAESPATVLGSNRRKKFSLTSRSFWLCVFVPYHKAFQNKTFLTVYLSLFFLTIPLSLSYAAVVLSLLISAAAVAVSAAASAAAVVISLIAYAAVCVIAAPCYIVMGIFDFRTSFANGLAMIAGGVALAGLAILFLWLFKSCNTLRILCFVKRENRTAAFARAKKHRRLWALFYIIAPIALIAGGLLFVIAFKSANWDIAVFKKTFDVVDWFKRNFR